MAENERRRTEETGIAGKSLSVVEEEGGWKRSVLVACMSQEGPRLRRDKMLVVGAGDAGAIRGGLRLSWKCSGSDGPGLGPGFESVPGSPLARAGRLCGAVSVRRKGGEFCSRPLCVAAVAAAAAVVPEPDREGGRHDGNVGDAVAAHNDGNLFHRASVDSAADAGGGRGDSDGGYCGGGASRGADKVAVAAGSDSAVEGIGRPVAAVAGSAAEPLTARQVDCAVVGCREGGVDGDREEMEPSPPRPSSLKDLKNAINQK